jgi:two-component system, OmpR family, alkaline phosphatase synthesis response regulator PhoP
LKARILVVEDNADLAAGIEYNLGLEGYDVRVAGDGVVALSIAREWAPQLVLLDLMLPGMDGYKVLQTLRAEPHGATVPVIILSARSEEADKVRGFRMDADQYVTKPFSVLELLERIAALLRRSSRTAAVAGSREKPIRFGEIEIDTQARTVTKGGQLAALTPKAYELLLALVRREGKVAGRAELLKEVWGYGSFIMTRTVDSHIAELRRKLESDPANPRHIVTVWKVGYRFER